MPDKDPVPERGTPDAGPESIAAGDVTPTTSDGPPSDAASETEPHTDDDLRAADAARMDEAMDAFEWGRNPVTKLASWLADRIIDIKGDAVPRDGEDDPNGDGER